MEEKRRIRPIKVLEVIRQGQIGGGESHLLDLIAGFKSSDVIPIVMAFTPGHLIKTLESKGVKCYVLPTEKPFDFSVFRAIKKIVRDEKIDIVHAHGSRAASNMLWSRWTLKLPMVYTVHGWSFHQDQSRIVQKLRALSEKLICNNCRKVVCISKSNAKTGIDMFGLEKCDVIENGINLNLFNANAEGQNLRSDFNLSEDDFVVGLVARITCQKAPIEFAESIIKANAAEPRIKGLIVGEGDMKDQLVDYIKEQKAESIFRLSDFRTDVPDLLRMLNVYCLPSLWEGLSIALLEAMAMRKPVVVTPTDGTKEIISNGKNGIVVDFHRPDKLAEAYQNLYNDKKLSSNIGEEAFKLVKQRFDSQRVSDSIVEIYRQICSYK